MYYFSLFLLGFCARSTVSLKALKKKIPSIRQRIRQDNFFNVPILNFLSKGYKIRIASATWTSNRPLNRVTW